MNRSSTLASWVLASLLGGALSCSSAPPEARVEPVSSSADALSTSDVIARAQQWVTAMVPYCQSPNGQPDPDTSCSPTCERPGEPAAWDPYRSDCSGFVSWAWGLPAPGLDTSEFVPGQNSVPTVEIDGTTMQPGDACNIGGDHIVLFVNWIVPGQQAAFMEEPGCSATPNYAHAFTSNVEISGSQVTIDYEGSTFTAIRNPNLVASDGGTVTIGSDASTGVPCFVSTLGVSGECMLTTACAALGNHVSTPGYCPGADDIQCCTSTGQDAAAPGFDAGASEGGIANPGKDAGVGEPDGGRSEGPGDGGSAGPSGNDAGAFNFGGSGGGCATSPQPVGTSGYGAGLALGLALFGARRRRRP
jgi:MYXO-CTERM domain-containing protein